MTDMPLLQALRTRLHWYQARQKVLAENVANANTPGFRPRDLGDPGVVSGAVRSPALETTSLMHLAGLDGTRAEDRRDAARFETRPSGNAVNIEDEMLKSAQNGSDYQLAASLYQKSLAMMRVAATGRSA